MPMVKKGGNDEERDCKGPLPQHCMEGMGGGASLGHSVSTNFVANCSFLILKPLPFVCAAGDSKLAPRSKKNFP